MGDAREYFTSQFTLGLTLAGVSSAADPTLWVWPLITLKYAQAGGKNYTYELHFP